MLIRPATRSDLPQIVQIQSASAESEGWNASDYLDHKCEVADDGRQVRGYVVARQIVAEEFEILDIAVAPAWRRQGVGSALMEHICAGMTGSGYLEVRASNLRAQRVYTRQGWLPTGRRIRYYTNPVEDAVVMKMQK